METLLQDLRYAARSLRRSPGFTAVAVLTLALGIGATTAVFSAVNALLIRPLGVPAPKQLVELERVGERGYTSETLSYPLYQRLNQAAGGVVSLAAYSLEEFSIRTGELAEPSTGYAVSGSYWTTLGVRPAVGRFFGAAEDTPGDPAPVAVLSHRAWRERFSGAPDVVGRQLRLNGRPLTVIGVAPAGFGGTVAAFSPEVWVPLANLPLLRGTESLRNVEQIGDLFVFGRLAPSVPLERAETALNVAYGGWAAEAAGAAPAEGAIRTRPLSQVPSSARGPLFGFLTMLFIAATLVLAIASVNVAGMLLARGTTRGKETAIRLAVGAGRARLIRQLLTESVLLWTLGGFVGVVASVWALQLLLRVELPIPARWELNLNPDLRVLAFALLLSLATAVLFGLAPATTATRPDLVRALKDTGLRGRGPTRVRNALVVTQIALSLLLLAGAALFVRALQHASGIHPGFAIDGAVIASFDFSLNSYNSARGATLLDEVRRRLEAAPDVETTAVATAVPLGPIYRFDQVEIPGHRNTPERPAFGVDLNSVDPAYFRAMKIPLSRGRAFTDADQPGTTAVAIIGETMARRFWPEGGALGARIRRGDTQLEIVGIAADVRNYSLGSEAGLYMYTPYAQNPQNPATLILRTRGDERAALERARREVRVLDADAPLMNSAILRDWIGIKLIPQRIAAAVTGAFGVVGLLLVAVGLFGIISYAVGLRTREIGVRVALGARPLDVVRLVLRQAAVLIALGLVGGAALTVAGTRLLSSFLFGLDPLDPLALGGAVALLVTVALVAAFFPARRATRVDPMIALRAE